MRPMGEANGVSWQVASSDPRTKAYFSQPVDCPCPTPYLCRQMYDPKSLPSQLCGSGFDSSIHGSPHAARIGVKCGEGGAVAPPLPRMAGILALYAQVQASTSPSLSSAL